MLICLHISYRKSGAGRRVCGQACMRVCVSTGIRICMYTGILASGHMYLQNIFKLVDIYARRHRIFGEGSLGGEHACMHVIM
jgi:hypothetical protein